MRQGAVIFGIGNRTKGRFEVVVKRKVTRGFGRDFGSVFCGAFGHVHGRAVSQRQCGRYLCGCLDGTGIRVNNSNCRFGVGCKQPLQTVSHVIGFANVGLLPIVECHGILAVQFQKRFQRRHPCRIGCQGRRAEIHLWQLRRRADPVICRVKGWARVWVRVWARVWARVWQIRPGCGDRAVDRLADAGKLGGHATGDRGQ